MRKTNHQLTNEEIFKHIDLIAHQNDFYQTNTQCFSRMENIFLNTDKELNELFDSMVITFLDERATCSRDWLIDILKKDLEFHSKNAKEAYSLFARFKFEEYTQAVSLMFHQDV